MIEVDITRVTHQRSLQIISIVLGLLIAPLSFLYNFYNDVFNATDTFKLILLALTIGAPLVLIGTSVPIMNNRILKKARKIIFPKESDTFPKKVSEFKTIAFDAFDEKREDVSKLMIDVFGESGQLTMAILYIPCVLKFFIELSHRTAIWICIISFIAAYILSMLFAIIRIIRSVPETAQELKDSNLNKNDNPPDETTLPV